MSLSDNISALAERTGQEMAKLPGIDRRVTALESSDREQTTAINNALTVANSKAPDGFGLGAAQGRFVADCKTEAWKFSLYYTTEATRNRPPYSWCSLLALPYDKSVHIYAFHHENRAVYRLVRTPQGTYYGWDEVVDYRGYVNNANLAQNTILLNGKNEADLSVNYAGSAGYANARFIDAIPLNTQDTGMNLPAGGTWLVYTMYYVHGGDYFEVNGRNGPWLDYQSGGSWVDGYRVGFALRIS